MADDKIFFKFEAKPPRICNYEGERVWKDEDEWYATADLGSRGFIVCRPSDTPFPKFLNSKRQILSVSGLLREAIADYLQSIRDEGNPKDFVLDGFYCTRASERSYTEFPGKVKPGKVPSHLVFYALDVYSLSVFTEGEGTHDFTRRRKRLYGIIGSIDNSCCMMAKCQKVESKKQFEKMRIDVASIRDLGLILCKDAPYVSGRSGNLLRVPSIGDE